MKSKFFVFAAVVSLGFLLGFVTKAHSIPHLGIDPHDIVISDVYLSFEPAPLTVCARELDADCDHVNNIVDTDDDNDGILDESDNCPLIANADLADFDGDGLGDACDDDIDGDDVLNDADSCAADTPADVAVNPAGCPDSDGDEIFDDADKCADTPAGTVVDATGCPVPIVIEQPFTVDNLNEPVGGYDNTGIQSVASTDNFADGGCSLIGNSNSSGILSALLLAISLAPIGLRRRIK